jgi:hypothetical protein
LEDLHGLGLGRDLVSDLGLLDLVSLHNDSEQLGIVRVINPHQALQVDDAKRQGVLGCSRQSDLEVGQFGTDARQVIVANVYFFV